MMRNFTPAIIYKKTLLSKINTHKKTTAPKEVAVFLKQD